MTRTTPSRMRQLARRLAIELGFQASELERMTLGDLLWWLAEGEE